MADAKICSRFVRAAHRCYGYLASDGGAVPYGAIFFLLASILLGLGVGALVAITFNLELERSAMIGALLAIGGIGAWLIVVAVVVGVSNVTRYADTDQPPRRARHLIDDLSEWRHRHGQ